MLTLLQKRNIAIVTAVACLGTFVIAFALGAHEAAPGEPTLCSGGICPDLFLKMPPEIFALLFMVGVGTFAALSASHFHHLLVEVRRLVAFQNRP